MKLRVLWFGRTGASPFETEIETYRKRIGRRWTAEDLALKPARGGRAGDPRKVLSQEAEAVRRHLPDVCQLVVLDEGGQSVDSEDFARLLSKFESAGAGEVVFVVGSDLGLDEDLRRQADLVISLSPLTLPHLIARLLLWEQVFRATHILGGGGYHRRTVQ